MRRCGCWADVAVFGHVTCRLRPPRHEPVLLLCASRRCWDQHSDGCYPLATLAERVAEMAGAR